MFVGRTLRKITQIVTIQLCPALKPLMALNNFLGLIFEIFQVFFMIEMVFHHFFLVHFLQEIRGDGGGKFLVLKLGIGRDRVKISRNINGKLTLTSSKNMLLTIFLK